MPAVAPRHSIRVPSDMVVTVRSLAALATKFTAADLADLVDRLIDQAAQRAIERLQLRH